MPNIQDVGIDPDYTGLLKKLHADLVNELIPYIRTRTLIRNQTTEIDEAPTRDQILMKEKLNRLGFALHNRRAEVAHTAVIQLAQLTINTIEDEKGAEIIIRQFRAIINCAVIKNDGHSVVFGKSRQISTASRYWFLPKPRSVNTYFHMRKLIDSCAEKLAISATATDQEQHIGYTELLDEFRATLVDKLTARLSTRAFIRDKAICDHRDLTRSEVLRYGKDTWTWEGVFKTTYQIAVDLNELPINSIESKEQADEIFQKLKEIIDPVLTYRYADDDKQDYMVSLIINAIDFYEKTLTNLAPVSHQQGRIARAVSK